MQIATTPTNKPTGQSLFTLPTPLPSTPSSTSSSPHKHDFNDMLSGEETSIRMNSFNSDDDSVMVHSQHDAALTNHQPLLTHHFRKIKNVKQAWQDTDMVKTRTRMDTNKTYTAVLPRLYCEQCHGDSYVIDYDTQYKHWLLKEDMWFDKEFINQFALLLQHTSHQVASVHSMPQLVICNFPEHDWAHGTEKIDVNTVAADTMVCILCDGTHYAVMEVDVKGQIISVYDGFASSTSVRKWVKYAKFVLQSVGVIPITAAGKFR